MNKFILLVIISFFIINVFANKSDYISLYKKSITEIILTSVDTPHVNGSTVDIQVKVKGMNDLKSLQFSINWDVAHLEYVSVRDFLPVSGLDTSQVGTAFIKSGKLSVTMVNNKISNINILDSSVLFVITFKIIKEVGCTVINIGNSPTPVEVFIGNEQADVNTKEYLLCISDFTCNLQDSIVHTSCSGKSDGKIMLLGNPCSNTEIKWSNGVSGSKIEGLPTGNYSASVYYKGKEVKKLGPFILSSPSAIRINSKIINNKCPNSQEAEIEVQAAGGTGILMYKWNTGNLTQTIKNARSGSYTVTISDEKMCSKDTTFILRDPESLNVKIDITHPKTINSKDGRILVITIGGVSPITYFLNGQKSSNNISSAQVGVYNFTVVDGNGCKIDSTINLMAINPTFLAYNTITPNGDGMNDKLDFGDNSIKKEIYIYNRWNNLVYHSKDYKNDWDGIQNSQFGNIFYYVLIYQENNKSKKIKSTLTVLR